MRKICSRVLELDTRNTARKKTQKCYKEDRKVRTSYSKKYILENYQSCILSNRDQQGLREPERDQPIQEPGRDRAYKKMLWSTVEQRAWATYRTNKSAAELHETISKEKVDFPLLTATWHRVQSQKLKWLQSEMKETAFSAYPTLLQ